MKSEVNIPVINQKRRRKRKNKYTNLRRPVPSQRTPPHKKSTPPRRGPPRPPKKKKPLKKRPLSSKLSSILPAAPKSFQKQSFLGKIGSKLGKGLMSLSGKGRKKPQQRNIKRRPKHHGKARMFFLCLWPTGQAKNTKCINWWNGSGKLRKS